MDSCRSFFHGEAVGQQSICMSSYNRKRKKLIDLFDLKVASAALLIAAGVVVAIISFLGSLGAYKEIRCMLLTFFVILFFIFVLMLIGGILGYVFRNQVFVVTFDKSIHHKNMT